MIYLGDEWAFVLLNYVCYFCHAPLRLGLRQPVCLAHGKTMWLHKDRRKLFHGLKREAKDEAAWL